MNGTRPLRPLLVLVIGIAIGAGGTMLLTPSETTTPPTYATSTATGCSTEPLPSGWLGQIGVDESRVVILNVTIGHDSPGIDLTHSLTEVSDGTFRFAITSTPTTEKGEPPAGCHPRTTLEASISLPADYEILEITFDGDPFATVENDEESFPSFRVVQPVES